MTQQRMSCMLTLIGCLLFAWPTRAQELSAVDQLQQSTRAETLRETQFFMSQIAPLELNIQEKLLKARLINTQLTFDPGGAWKPGDWYHKEALTVEKDQWSFSSVIYWYIKEKGHFRLQLIVKVEPNADMQAWARVRDEYTEYAKEEIELTETWRRNQATLVVVGEVKSFTWEKNLGYEYHKFYTTLGQFDFYSMMSAYTLTLNLGSCTAGPFTYGTFQGPLVDHTKLLEEKIAQWVKFYMGKAPEPERLLPKNYP